MDLFFKKPAKEFTETLPIGNGKLGAMIYGEILREQIVLNESSMWSGSYEETDRKDSFNYLEEIRKLISEDKNFEAEQLFLKHFTCLGKGTNYAHGADAPFGCYQILGRLHISYFQATSFSRETSECVEDYKRILNIKNGLANVSFKTWDINYNRFYLASKKQKTIYIYLTASKENKINISIGLDRDERFNTKIINNNSLLMTGQLNDGYETNKGIKYACCVSAKAEGGEILLDSNKIIVKNANNVLIAINANTNMKDFVNVNCEDEILKTIEENTNALKLDWETILKENEEDLKDYNNSMELYLGENTSLKKLTTEERIKRFLNGNEDNELIAFYVMYAKYLLNACSREDSLPANLQGIWSDEIQTPWNGDWHLNAQQMIYWLAEKANLSNCHIPYLLLTENLAKNGKKTAKAYYNARGWLAHTCTNPWGFTSPCEDAAWGSTTGSPAWQCHHLWEHLLYTNDTNYLKWAYPIMKEATYFYIDMLIEDKKTGYLITSPSSSPENSFYDEKNRVYSLCEGPTYDKMLVYSLFTYCIEAQYILKDDKEFLDELLCLRKKLAPIKIGSDGRIMEWNKEYKEAMPYHRHLSHLWGAYPGQMIKPEYDTNFVNATKKSLDMRGTSTVGWAIAYRMCLWARLRESEKAYEYIKTMFSYSTGKNLFNLAYHCDETLENPDIPDLENCRYPFQIDGNQGNATGILLMLEDDFLTINSDGSFNIEIVLLPALPKQFSSGYIKGICSKGGIKIDFSWENQNLKDVYFYGEIGTKFKVWYKNNCYN
ncbi:MAG: glycoside hydrolase family 95 protein, partial [Eubacteriales bacterium]|nr:glycoside hydrolase family 95 protein [Eubacteriales bacterium]